MKKNVEDPYERGTLNSDRARAVRVTREGALNRNGKGAIREKK